MGMRATKVLEESQKVRKLYYGSEYPCKIRDCQFNQHISDNQSNNDVLDSVLSDSGIKLIIAPTGAGKSTAILNRAKELVARDKDYKVFFDLPARTLALQMGNNDGITSMVGGDSYDEEIPIIATTYEKMTNVEEYIGEQASQGTGRKTVLVLDESHLLTTMHMFREKAIKGIIRCIEKKYFHSVVLVTATPYPSSLFHCDEIVEFQSSNSLPNIDRLEIIEVDDPIEYIKGLDYRSEFPFIRLNKIEEIDNLRKQMPQTFARLTKDDKKTKAYLDIVDYGKIDSTGISGVLATSVVDTGVSISKYPDNIVPMAVFLDNNISTDDIEQFLNRLRRDGNRHVKCARVIIKKLKQREISVSLVTMEEIETCICEFQDVRMEMGDLYINDTGSMDAVQEGSYRLRFQIGTNVFYRYIMVASNGVASEKKYIRNSAVPMVFKGMGFRPFIEILEENYGKEKELADLYEELEGIYERKRQALKLSITDMDCEKRKHDALIRQLISGYIKEAGEIGDCLSCENRKVEADKRICYEISYNQFQRQYYHNHDILAKELEERLCTKVVLINQDTAKSKRVARTKEDLWENIEDLRLELEKNSNEHFWNFLMGHNNQYLYLYSKRKIVYKIREQDHIMGQLKMLEKAGIKGETALGIVSTSRGMKKINDYIKCYHIIIYNSLLKQFGGTDINEIPCYKGKKRESMIQSVIYCYLTGIGKASYKVTKVLAGKIITFYKESYPTDMKPPTKSKIMDTIKKMYKKKDDEYVFNELRIDEQEIFKLVSSDYK